MRTRLIFAAIVALLVAAIATLMTDSSHPHALPTPTGTIIVSSPRPDIKLGPAMIELLQQAAVVIAPPAPTPVSTPAPTPKSVKSIPVEPKPVVVPVDHNTVWDRLAQCESSGNWADTAGQFEGGVQFLNSTWLAYGGAQFAQHAYDATREEQIIVAERQLAGRPDWSAWPACSRKLGLR